jgi:DNA repair exonuclease SbcCD ATPase subunit
MKIIALEAENVKHLRVVNINPDGSLVVIGGDNAQGKTCVLDAIEYALNGAGSVPSKPIRNGQKKARVVLDLGDIVVTRIFTSNGTNLTVKNKDGATFPSPQAMLDKLVGQLSFDPLEFSKMDAKKQSEVLKQLVGLDFDSLNAKYKKHFDERTVVNREGKALKARLDQMIKHDDTPDKEVSISELSGQYTKAIEHNQNLIFRRNELDTEVHELDTLKKRVSALTKSIKSKEASLRGAKEVDIKAIKVRMDKAEEMNSLVRQNRMYNEVDAQVSDLRKKSISLSDKITALVDKKAEALAKAKFPIEGLAIDEEGVIFEDIPFVQCSAAQRIRVSVAIGLAMNPKLRVLLIREGSMLDSKNLAMVAKMAEKADAQIWMERVSKGKECQIIMEDGSVRIEKRETANAK